MRNFNQGYKSSSINATSCFAEREVTLTEIDSMLVNGEINKDEAKILTIQWAVDTGNAHMLPALLPALQ